MILRTGKKNKGFLLLEVMVSAAIVSIALTIILSSFISSIRAIELSKDYFKAGLLIEEKFCELKSVSIKEGLSEGTFKDFGNKFSWHLNVAGIEDSHFNEVVLEVSWGRGSKNHSISTSTYL